MRECRGGLRPRGTSPAPQLIRRGDAQPIGNFQLIYTQSRELAPKLQNENIHCPASRCGGQGRRGTGGCSVSAARCRLSYCARLNWMQKELQTSGRDHGALSNTISRIPTTIPPLLSPLPPSCPRSLSFALSLLSTTLPSSPPSLAPRLRITLIFPAVVSRTNNAAGPARVCVRGNERNERSRVCVCRAIERKSRGRTACEGEGRGEI